MNNLFKKRVSADWIENQWLGKTAPERSGYDS